jgi:hypothetical protein
MHSTAPNLTQLQNFALNGTGTLHFGSNYNQNRMSQNPKSTRPYFPQLDGVRAVAALMVMVFHFLHDTGVAGIAMFGQTGVDLFCALGVPHHNHPSPGAAQRLA